MISRAELLAFMRHATQASVSAAGEPQAAIVGIVVSEEFEIFFDTLGTSRKANNLRRNPRVAFVVGPALAKSARTVQFDGVADEPAGETLDRLVDLYFATFPDGKARQSWAGIAYFRVRPVWVRYSDYANDPAEIVELRGEDLQTEWR